MSIGKNVLFTFILLFLIFPVLQLKYGFIKETRLNGYYRLQDKPDLKRFTWHRWFDKSFQDEYLKRNEDHISFRCTLFRINNQSDYSLFGIAHALGFIRGKQGYLFEEDYIHEYTGRFFIGENALNKKLQRLKDVRDSLAAHKVNLIVVLEPGKASFYPEYIPRHYHPEKKKRTNYDYYVQGLKTLNIPYLDLNSYFLQLKDTSRYPLFPKYGMHWSIFGMAIAMDTLRKFIEKETGDQLPGYRIGRIETTESLRYSDNDIGVLLNLICPLPKVKAAYPELIFTSEPEKKKLSLLVIADSYYVNMLDFAIPNLFGKQEYWYYNSKVYPDVIDDQNPVFVDKTKLTEKLKNFDLVMLMSSEINFHCFFWDFADEAYLSFHPEVKDGHLYKTENLIRKSREWFRAIADKAVANHYLLEDVIHADAEFMFTKQFNELQDKTKADTIDIIAINIRNNPDLMKMISVKAKAQQISDEEMIQRDALWVYEQQKKH